MPVSQSCVPCWWTISALLLCCIGMFGFVAGAVEVEEGLFLVLTEEDQGCTAACADENLVCSYESLVAGEPYGTAMALADSVEMAGGTCVEVVGQRLGTRNPRIDVDGRCYGKDSGQTNFNCGLDAGEAGGVRLCSCFGIGSCIPSCLAVSGQLGICGKANGECTGCPVEEACKKLCERCVGRAQDFGGLECDCSEFGSPPTFAPTKDDNIFDEPTITTLSPSDTSFPSSVPSDAPSDASLPSSVPSDAPSAPTVSPTQSPTTILPPEDYALIWRDDFDGDDINTTNWSRGLVYDVDPSQHVLWNPKVGGPNLLSALYDGYILDENTYTTGTGFLKLRNKEQDPPIQGTSPVGTFHYSNAFANSLHKVFFNGSQQGKGNYLEIRAKFPTGNVGKVWSAIWMVPESEEWPPEIDIWEYFGLFFNADWGFDQMQFRVRYGWPGNTTAAKRRLGNFQTRWTQDFHIYGWLWTRDIMIWYIDGAQVGTIERGIDVFPWRWPDEDMAFVLQQATMESIDPNDGNMTTDFPNVLTIDYMALYEKG